MEQSEIGGLMQQLKIGGTSTDQLNNPGGILEITSFTDIQDSVTLHFQIIRLPKQIYAWIGYNSAKLGHLDVAAPIRPNNTISVSSIFDGTFDNTGSSIARRLVLRTGLNIILACNIPKSNPMIELATEGVAVTFLIRLRD